MLDLMLWTGVILKENAFSGANAPSSFSRSWLFL
jgi:hypothetical protein